ncbi:MAG: GIDE domain-containing protein, partial [Spirochaetia bacterium]
AQKHASFYLTDETGKIIIYTKGANIINLHQTSRVYYLNKQRLPRAILAVLSEHKINIDGMLSKYNRLCFSEVVIAPDDYLLISGEVCDPEIKKIEQGSSDKEYIISGMPEKTTVRKLKKKFLFNLIAGILCFSVCAFFLLLKAISLL